MTVTAKGIAKKLGLSESTVSLVINKKRGVSKETRERVLATAREMGYPLSSDVYSVSEYKGQIGVFVLQDHESAGEKISPFSNYVDGISFICKSKGYICDMRFLQDKSELALFLNSTKAKRYKGLLLISRGVEDDYIRMSRQKHIPAIGCCISKLTDEAGELLVTDLVDMIEINETISS